ncbi:MAG: tRNA (guanosine(46)-N7)-methyltransferase TrmB, partial [Arenimonas sp.]|nr:tRNA (guanosine(46)-N7)-methyltransferase TrmB [Arenimonas sp.]
VGRLLNAAASEALANLRVYQHDAVDVLQQEIAPASLAEVRIYFPDPWHKKRHNKRRLVQPEFVARVCERLAPGGLLHVATDWEPYAEHLWDVLDAEPRLRNLAGPRGSSARPDWRRQTHFETRGLKLGHGVWDLLYQRI